MQKEGRLCVQCRVHKTLSFGISRGVSERGMHLWEVRRQILVHPIFWGAGSGCKGLEFLATARTTGRRPANGKKPSGISTLATFTGLTHPFYAPWVLGVGYGG